MYNSIHYSKTLNYCGVSWNDPYIFNPKNLNIYFKLKIENIYLSNYPLSDYQKYLLKKIYQFRKLGFSYKRTSNFLMRTKLDQQEVRVFL